MSINSQIRKRIEQVSKQQGISYRAWSKLAGLGPNGISQFMNNHESRSLKLDTLERIAKAVSVSITSLIAEESFKIDKMLLEKIIQYVVNAHPNPKGRADNISKAIATIYSTAIEHRINHNDTNKLTFAAEIMSRELGE